MLEIRLQAMCLIWRYNFYCTPRIQMFARFSWSEARTHVKTAMLHLHSITEYCIRYKVLHQGERQIKRQIDKLKDRGFTTRPRPIKKITRTLSEEKNINSNSLQYMYLFFQTVYCNYKLLILHDLLTMVIQSFSSGKWWALYTLPLEKYEIIKWNGDHKKTGLTCIRKGTAIPSLCSLIIPPMDREVLEP